MRATFPKLSRLRGGGHKLRRHPIQPLEPRLVLAADPVAAGFAFHLDFDGATGVSYEGPVRVENIDLAPFSVASADLLGAEQQVIAATLELLNGWFKNLGARFTLTPPSSDSRYSTIYVGGDGAPFSAYGSFLGLAEQIDDGNVDHTDVAFVFSDLIRPKDPVAAEYSRMLAEVIAHEAAHLLGYGHAEGDEAAGPLGHVAYAQGVANPAHQWISLQGYQFFEDKFGESEIKDFMGTISTTAGGFNELFIEGIIDEDESAENPFGQGESIGSGLANHPSLRHFWGHDGNYQREFDDGLLTFDSAANRAIKYIIGGLGVTGEFDDDWGDGTTINNVAVRGEGATFAYLDGRKGQAYYWLGHAAHLLQDMTVPAHVHNDAHLEVFGVGVGPDPFHDWADGIEFSSLPFPLNNPNRVAQFSDTNPNRWATWGFLEVDEGENGVGRAGGAIESSTIRSPQRVISQTSTPYPAGTIETIKPLYALFYDTASIGDDFDSKDSLGEIDQGNRLSGDNPSAPIDYANWSMEELEEIGDRVVPRAMQATAEIIRFFYSQVNLQAPEVSFDDLTSTDPLNPQIAPSSRFDVLATASDAFRGNNGVGAFRLEYQQRQSNGTFDDRLWQELVIEQVNRDGTTAHVQSSFQGLPGQVYAFRFTAEDGGGYRSGERIDALQSDADVGQAAVVYVQIGGVNVVNAIDRSDSMSGANLAAARQAVARFAFLLQPADKIGVVSFSSSASVNFPLTALALDGSVSTQTQAVAALDRLQADGATSIGAGIRAADAELDRFPADSTRAMIVLSDGKNNTTPDPIEVVLGEVDPSVRIFTIGIGSQADAGLLSTIAELRSGMYFSAAGPEELADIYAEIAGVMLEGQRSFTPPSQQSAPLVRSIAVDASSDAPFEESLPESVAPTDNASAPREIGQFGPAIRAASLSASPEAFVESLYADLLGRLPDPAGMSHWVALLAAGASPTDVVVGIVGSVEYRTNLVQDLYRLLLRRDADPDGLARWVAFLEQGGGVEELKRLLISSLEYYRDRAGGTNAGFLASLYEDVLGRGVDPSGQARWNELLTASDPSDATTRVIVAAAVANSDEGFNRLVGEFFARYLSRAVDPDGRQFFVEALVAGGSQESVLARILASQEYLVRATDAPDTQPPTIVIESPESGLSTRFNPVVVGRVMDNRGAPLVTAQLDDGASFDVPVDVSGSFQFETMFPLDGGADGAHVLRFLATDRSGNVSPEALLAFTLDTRPPMAPEFDLSAASSVVGAHQTSAARVLLLGATEPHATIVLEPLGVTAIAGATGQFQFPSVALDVGANHFVATAMDAAGNASSFSATIERIAASAESDVVLDWNRTLLDAVRTDGATPTMSSRAMAMVQTAVFDAVSSVQGTPGYYIQTPSPIGSSPEAAVAAAAHRVLAYLYPAQADFLDAALADSLSEIDEGQGKLDGLTVGLSVADAVIALRAQDGFDAYSTYERGADAGQWQPTPPMFMAALAPQWADLEPFAMTAGDQFRPQGPPDLTSQAWTEAYEEVKEFGSSTSTVRTADETQIARFWADGPGTFTPPGHWNNIATQIAASQFNSLAENARLLAQLNIALADAAVVAWDAKYHYGLWRPVTAIREGDNDGNPDTQGDPDWTPLLNTPPFPEYVSGHSTFSGAADAILTSYFGDDVAFVTDSSSLPGVVRSYDSFHSAALEAGQSRIYGGIHYQFANQDGHEAGHALAQHVMDQFDANVDAQPPRVLVTSHRSGVVTASDVTLVGRVLDNLSGVQTLEVQMDGGAFAPLAFDEHGNFSLVTAFAADGVHDLGIRATDFSGNVSSIVSFTVTLDTTAPEISLNEPLLNAMLIAGNRVRGMADGTGSAIASLSYAFESGPSFPIIFDRATGEFDDPLDLSHLTAGEHSLTLTASDAAGNVRQLSVEVALDQLIPLTVTEFSPLAGANDVGVTFRPRVDFSRPVDPLTLTDESFYLTEPSGDKLSATIVVSDDATFAWLFPQGAMPGASNLTVTIDGSLIADASGAQLDADRDGAPGGMAQVRFTTVSLANVMGTSLGGVVVDPGPDLRPGTFDDVRVGPDGLLNTADDLYLRPLAGVRAFIIGLEDQAVFTDSQGRFLFESAPVGNVKLVLDGQTAVDAPDGVYFPEMVMDLNLEVGQANTVMGSMGLPQQAEALAAVRGVYLPRLQTSILEDVNPTGTSVIGVGATASPNLTPEQRELLWIEVAAGSLIGEDGQPLASGQVGISTVPPELVRDMLPPGILEHTFDITVQAPGVATFTTPAAMTFPNLFQAAPGTKLNFLSFDHTTGRLVIEGTATVSADGKSVSTDPGSGITHPGWHGLTPEGSQTQSPCEPATHDIEVPPITTIGIEVEGSTDPDVLNHQFFVGDEGEFTLFFENNAAKLSALEDDCGIINRRSIPLVIELKVTGANEFLDGLSTQKFLLMPQQEKRIHVEVKDLLTRSRLELATANFLYGAKVTILGYALGDRDVPLVNEEMFLYRFLDVGDSIHTDGRVLFGETLADGANGRYLEKRLVEVMPEDAQPTYALASNGNLVGANLSFNGDRIRFDPAALAEGFVVDTLRVTPPAGGAVGGINLGGIASDVSEFPLLTVHEAAIEAGEPLPPQLVDADFGDVTVDGPGGAQQVVQAFLFNGGGDELTVTSVSVMGGGGAFSIVGLGVVPFTLADFDPDNPTPSTRAIQVRFDPTVSGPVEAVLRIESDTFSGEAVTISVHGVGVSPAGDIALEFAGNNNAGGALVSAAPAEFAAFVSIRNRGANVLNVTDVFAGGVTGEFDVTGLPPGFGPGNPLVLDPGASFPLNLVFDPTSIGLRVGDIQIMSDDPDTPLLRQSVVGTGLNDTGPAPDYGDDFIVVETPLRPGSPKLRAKSDGGGNFSFFLPAQEAIHHVVFDPVSGLVAHDFGVTARSGQPTHIPELVFGASVTADTDGDYLPDDIELAIGTSSMAVDTDGDGLSDFVEITLGLDPLGGRSFPTGVVAGLRLNGEAREVVVEDSPLDAGQRIAYVATGSHGLAIADVSQFSSPVLLGQLDLPGDNGDVAVDSTRGLAAVAGGAAGLHLVDVSDPTRPMLEQTVPLADGASRVEVFGGSAFVASGGSVVNVDLATGAVLSEALTGISDVTDIAIDGSIIYSMNQIGVLSALEVVGLNLVPRGELSVPTTGGRLFVADGVAYALAPNNPNPGGGNPLGGYVTVDINDPDNLTPVRGSDLDPPLGLAAALAANGSSLGVLVGATGQINAIDVLDLAPTADAATFVARFLLPAVPEAVRISDGIAFVADGAGGLQIVNYLPFDNQGQPPVVMLSSPLQDLAPGMPGVQIVEGASIPIRVEATDDVQVSRVEFLVNGQVVGTDLSYPFGQDRIPLPGPGVSTVVLEARAIDTGGNTGRSNLLTFELVPDTFAPAINLVSPANGETLAPGVRSVRVDFSEPLASATVTTANFQLREFGAGLIVPQGIALLNGGRTVVLSYDPLPAGDYDLEIDALQVTDLAGNPLGATDVVSGFTLLDADVFWIGGSGDWNDEDNWSTGVVPGPTDHVLISVPGDIVVTFVGPGADGDGNPLFVSVASLQSDESIVFFGDDNDASGGLAFAEASRISGEVSIQGDMFYAGPGELTLAGDTTWTSGAIATGGSVRNEGTLTIQGSGVASLFGGLTNSGTILHPASGRLFLGGGTLTNLAGALYELQGGGAGPQLAPIIGAPGGAGFQNAGTVRKTGAGESIIDVPLNNMATVDVQVGSLSLRASGAITDATYSVAQDAILSFVSGTHTFAGASLANGDGQVRISGGVLNGAGAFTLEGDSLWTSGSIALAGGLTNTGALTISGVGTRVLGGVFNNEGVVSHTATGQLQFADGVLNNLAGGVYDLDAGSFTLAFASTGEVNNAGSLTKAGVTGVIPIRVMFNNTGAVDVLTGTLNLEAGGASSGDFTAALGAAIAFAGGAHLLEDGFNFAGAGDVRIIAGSAQVNADGAAVNFDLSSGSLTGAGELTVTGSMDWSGGTMSGSGSTRIQSGAALNISGAIVKSLTGRTLDNAGAAVWEGTGRIAMTDAVLNNLVGGIFDIQTDALLQRAAGSAAFNNAGTLRKTAGTGTSEVQAAFANTGIVEAQSGTLRFAGGFVQTAGETELAGGSLAATGPVNIQGGKLSGVGTVGANVINAGEVSPGASAGGLTISGTYTQTASSTLSIEIGGLGLAEFDRLAITGQATLGGTLNVTLIGEFDSDIASGDTFQVMTFASSTPGAFANVNVVGLPPGLAINVDVSATDVTLEAAMALLASSSRAPAGLSGPLGTVSDADLARMLDAALFHWSTSPDAAGALQSLSGLPIRIADLPGALLATASPRAITIDRDGAGHGWFVDLTPFDDLEFAQDAAAAQLRLASAEAADRIDLLTVVMHELGHLLGLDHDLDGPHDKLMSAELEPRVRRLP